MELCMICAKDVRRYVREKDAILIDLRDEEDYREFHIPGAISVPTENLAKFMRRTDKRRLHIFYCDHGVLSIQEGRRYLRQGYRICSLAGGIDAYLRQRYRAENFPWR